MSYAQGLVAGFQTNSQPMSASPFSSPAAPSNSGVASVGLHVYATSGNAQSISNNSDTTLKFDGTLLPGFAVATQPCFTYDATTGIATCIVAGTYQVITQYNSPSTQTSLALTILKGSTVQAASTVASQRVACETVVALVVGNTIKVNLTQVNGATAARAITDGNVSSTNMIALRLF